MSRPPRLQVYLINLDRAAERRQRMESRLTALNLPFQRITAIDGATLEFPHPDFSARSYRYLHGRKVIPAEVGCYLSHVECARKLLAGDASHALILEDDLAFPADFHSILDQALAHADDWDILRLSSMSKGPKFGYRRLACGRDLAVALTREKGAGAYIINRKAAKWICRKLMPMRLAYDIAFDLEYLGGLKACFIDPVPVSQREERVSQIQNNLRAYKYPRSRYLTVLPYRLWLEVSRLVSRLSLYGALSMRSDPRKTLIRAIPLILLLVLGIDEVFYD